uniref:DNA-directed RNA polymerase n=1 Tax=Pediastrum duplex TaxID=3105 RepID=A0A1W5RMJ3_PEDDU|nr:RNA polymerase beta subunit [Pediastrum duplex]AQU64403.1 RNA polymerase beta subunit [Pediastrum duplex]
MPKKKTRYFLPDFVDMQRQSFLNFLEKGIVEEFAKRNPITNVHKNIEIFFYPEYYRLTKPSYTIQQAVFYQKSYISKLYIPVQYTDRNKKKILLKWMLIAQLPLMTKRGHFVLNGSARVIVNQLVRSPGIYFRENFYEIYGNLWNPKPNAVAKRFYADIICLKGTWLRIEIDKDYCMWVRLKKGPKIPLLWFLIGMGLNEKMIFQSVISPNFLLKSFQKDTKNLKNYTRVHSQNVLSSVSAKKSQEIEGAEKRSEKTKKHKEAKAQKTYLYVKNPPEAWNEIAKLLNLKKGNIKTINKKTSIAVSNISKKNNKKKETLEFGRKWFFKKFMNSRTYDLSKQGRLSINQKLSLNLSPQQTTLTAQDLLSATDYLMKVEKGLYEIDDIDHLKNRRVRCSGDLIQVQFGIGLMRLEKAIRYKLNNDKNFFKNVISTYNTESAFVRFGSFASVPSLPHRLPSHRLPSPQLPSLRERSERSGLETSAAKEAEVPPKQKSEKAFARGAEATLKRTKKTNKYLNESNGSATKKNLSLHSFGIKRSENKDLKYNQKKNLNLKFLALNSIIQPKFVNGALKEFFGTHPLSQFMDQINPLSEMTHKRRLSSLGPGGVSRDTATLAVRGIHSSHYGRICPIETPEGKNTGLVNSLTTYARVNNKGFIETPFYSLYKGQVQKNSGRIYLSAEKEEFFKIATPDLNISNINFLPKQKIPVRVGKDFIPTFRRYVSFIGISPIQMISIATALIPFLEHDDANRALMGSNMQRQAVPLVRSQRSFIGTGLEARSVSDSGHALVTTKSGCILYVSGSKILLYTN